MSDFATGNTSITTEHIASQYGCGYHNGYIDRVYFIHKNDLCILDGEEIIELDHEDVTNKLLAPHQ